MFLKDRIRNREQLSGEIYVPHEKQKKLAETDSSKFEKY